MTSETSAKYVQHLLAQSLSTLQLTDKLDTIEVTSPDPQFGDYSTNAALVIAKKIKTNPNELAKQIVEELKNQDHNHIFADIIPVGGFINFRLSHDALLQNLEKITEQGDLYGCSLVGEGKTVVVEYFQNNVAKPPHVGHLRSAVIGDSLLRILRSQGFKAVSDTHIGDWGTQFGILMLAYKKFGDQKVIERDPINELNKLYVEMSKKIEQEPELREQAKAEFANLEKGDTENRKLWQWFVMESVADFERYRELLGLFRFDHNLGESFYEDKMPAVLEDLRQKKLLTESQGAQIVNLEDQKLGVAVLVKSDGATTYLLRDLATVKYRIDELKIDKALYVVDNRQSHHFQQVFEISRRAGYMSDPSVVEHVDFGFMSLPEGIISTRKGTTVSLENLISEAEKRALAIIKEKNPELNNQTAVAKVVALAAIKYFDLSHNRKTEIVFTWDKALSFEGNTGPYLQYAHARIQGILRKVGSGKGEGESISDYNASHLTLHASELGLLRKLNQFPEVVAQVAQDYLPNLLCNYLFELSQTFNTFYEAVPVLQESDVQLRSFRIQLISAVAKVLENGLYLLGIEAPEEM